MSEAVINFRMQGYCSSRAISHSVSGDVCLNDWNIIIRRQVSLIIVGYVEISCDMKMAQCKDRNMSSV